MMRDSDLLTISDILWARIAKLEAEVERLKTANSEADKILADGVADLQAENRRLQQTVDDYDELYDSLKEILVGVGL